ncbi:hypothetical protein [uncultured Paludibaculum sp.]|uniref:hypothetical protein n=1 Tax=uncultured Paludibaculum sp. TaxID=1765020 RepID=UPI002AAC2F9E|nr:hypothetical protein [uncultured Paludibaculum sp.]
MLDVSCSGLGMVVREEIPVGSWIRVEFGEVAVFGEVRYCRQQAGVGFRLGALTDWVVAKSDLARWGNSGRSDGDAHLCASFRQMKSSRTKYGPPV